MREYQCCEHDVVVQFAILEIDTLPVVLLDHPLLVVFFLSPVYTPSRPLC
jgi:hypothetical protein